MTEEQIKNKIHNLGLTVYKEERKYWRELKKLNAIPDIYKSNEELDKQLKDNLREFTTSGSGPTNLLKQGKNAIVLVPEISLTPQMVDRFLARFGENSVAVLHSKLSVGERYGDLPKILLKVASKTGKISTSRL